MGTVKERKKNWKNSSPALNTILLQNVFRTPELSLPHVRGLKQQTTKTTGCFYDLQQRKKKSTKVLFYYFFSPPLFVPVLSPKLNHLSMHRVEISKESLQWWIAYHVALTVQMQPGALTLRETIVLMANFTLKREESMQMIRVMTNGAHYHFTILLSFLQNSEIILCFMPRRGTQPVVCLFKARVKPGAGMIFLKYSFFCVCVCVDACLTLPNMIF